MKMILSLRRCPRCGKDIIITRRMADGPGGNKTFDALHCCQGRLLRAEDAPSAGNAFFALLKKVKELGMGESDDEGQK